MLRTSAPSAFPRFWLDERCFSLAHKEFRKRKKKCSEKILNSYLLSNQSSYIQYFPVPWLPCLWYYMVLVQLTTVGHCWPGQKVPSPYWFRNHKLFSKIFRIFFFAGDCTLTRSLKDISPYHPSAIFKSFFTRKKYYRSWSYIIIWYIFISIHWLPLRYVFVRLLYLK